MNKPVVPDLGLSCEDKFFAKGKVSDAEKACIEARVVVLQPDLIYMLEVPTPSPGATEVIDDGIKNITQGKLFKLIVDLSAAKPPNGEAREAIKYFLSNPNISKVALFTEKNKIMTYAARFVVSLAFKQGNFGIFQTYEEACKFLEV